jgi:hypothetical protein
MTGHNCRHCDAEIMYVGAVWLKRRVADVNGFCTNSPDDLHHPATEARDSAAGNVGDLPPRL